MNDSTTGPNAKPRLDLAGALELSPSPESYSVTVPEHVGHYIGGSFVEGRAEDRFETVNPASGERIASVATANESEVDRAVGAARKAFEGDWGKMPGSERGKILYRVARRLQERAREFAVLETRDNGKPIRETRDFDVPTAAAHFMYYAGWADKLDYVVQDAKPAGVCAQVIPWNFPLLMAAWKIAPALATGCTTVLKPAEQTPLTAMRLAEVFAECGVPDGVVNIVNGAGGTGAALVGHDNVDKVAFTGSTNIGRTILRQIAASNKKATMELGGKGAHIVFADAALDQAVEGVINGIFFNQGHVCCAGSRLLVEESIAEEFVERLKRRIDTLRIGEPIDKNTDIGAINSAEQLAVVSRYLQIARDEGAEVWQGGACPTPANNGYWVPPTLLTGVQQTNTVVREEIFGPVLAVLTFRTADEAVKKANDSEYGLSAGIWTEKTSKLFDVGHRLNAGVIWANGFNLFDPASPFGGIRHSGYGREGGLHGLWPYLGNVP